MLSMPTGDGLGIDAGVSRCRRWRKLPEGMEYEIPQIIGRELWDTLDRSARLSLGKYVKANSVEFGLEFLRKNPSNHAIYRRRV